jgi:Domain of unknown function (DUF4249)
MNFIKTKFNFSCVVIFLFVCLINWSCEDVIDPTLSEAEPVVNIDAWLNDKDETQVIQITWTIDYDENDKLPPTVSGCTVIVTDNIGNEYEFVEDTQKQDGTYVWTPATLGDVLAVVGRSYTLTVQLPAQVNTDPSYSGKVFTATSYMTPVPTVDSITYEVVEGNAFNNNNDGYSAEFWARDLLGSGNTYWIRTYKNGIYLNKPSEITIAYDAGITKDAGFDNVTFLPPLRLGINPDEVDENDDPLPPYELGDSIYVEIHSISEESFNYLNEVIDNTDRQTGIGSLFSSTPLANVSTNIISNGSVVVGFFNVAAVKGTGRVIR